MPDAWGNGYAPEAAQACLALAAKLGIEEVIAFTAVANLRSQRVMQKIGMECVGQFNHPALPEGHPCGGMCSTGQGSKDRFRQRASPAVHAAADIAGPRKPGNDNPRKPSSLPGVVAISGTR